MARSVEGNKKYKYLDEPDCSLKCFVCSEVADSPCQHGECGELFCKKCIDNDESRSSCPNCRMENPKYNEDKRSMREIKALRVKCKFNDKKCDWVGTVDTLEKHVSVCRLTKIPCPNECKYDDIVRQIKRKDLNEHLQRHCPKRDYECEYCGEKGTYVTITQDHDNTCEKKIVTCTNEECNMRMERMKIKNHLAEECEHTVISCEYTSIGCDVKMKRKDMRDHEQNDKAHFLMLINVINQLKGSVVKFQDKSVKWRRYFICAVIILVSILVAVICCVAYTNTAQCNTKIQLLKDDMRSSVASLREKDKAIEVNTESINHALAIEEKTRSLIESTNNSLVSLEKKCNECNNSLVSLEKKCNECVTKIQDDVDKLNDHIQSTDKSVASLEARSKMYAKKLSEDANANKILSQTLAVNKLNDHIQSTNNSVALLEAQSKTYAKELSFKIQSLKNDVGYMKKSIDNGTVTFKFKEYSDRKKGNNEIYSPSFHTSPNGYHMNIIVIANGIGIGDGSHVSVYFYLLKGKDDADLKWPFLGNVTIELLNQLEDKNHYSRVVHFTPEDNLRVGDPGRGYLRYILQSQLSGDSASNTQYLKDDALYFRISVKISPWLLHNMRHM